LWNGSRSRKNPDDTLVDRLLRHVADDLVGDLAVFKEQQRRNTSDAIARGSLAVLVNVQLQDLQLAFVACCYLLYDRRHRPTRPTPSGPENLPGPAAGTSTHHCQKLHRLRRLCLASFLLGCPELELPVD
jgi:hypothetical protein